MEGQKQQHLEKKEKKVKKIKNPNKQQLPLNPNWAQLQQKLNTRPGSKPSMPSDHVNKGTQSLILGKRKDRPDEPSEEDPHPNPLVPINHDSSLTDAVAMDCEMVGVGQANRSALGRVTLVNKWGNVIYDEFVRPMEFVVDFRTHISGIRPKDLKQGRFVYLGHTTDHYSLWFFDTICKTQHSIGYSLFAYIELAEHGSDREPEILVCFTAKNFPIVQKKVAELIKGRILVGHALSNDLKVLLLNHPKKDLRDSAEYPPFLKYGNREHRRKSLRHLASEFLGIDIQNGEHCPVEDARAAMLLYQKNKKEWEKFSKSQTRLNRKQQAKRRPKKILNENNHS
ncbi:RNA exonuclease 4 [Linum perenne]